MTVKEGNLVPRPCRTSCSRESWNLDDFHQTTNIKIISSTEKISVVICIVGKIRKNSCRLHQRRSIEELLQNFAQPSANWGKLVLRKNFGIGAGCRILTETYVIASIVTLRQYRKWVNTIVSSGIRRT